MITLVRAMYLSLVVLIFFPHASYACSCDYAGAFIKFSEGQTVIRGRVTSYGEKLSHGETLYATMKVSVVEVINGQHDHSEVRFRGDPGQLCLTYVNSNQYAVGSEHLFVLFNGEKRQDLARCGEVSVAIFDGKVHGSEYEGDKWTSYSVDYDEFIEALKK